MADLSRPETIYRAGSTPRGEEILRAEVRPEHGADRVSMASDGLTVIISSLVASVFTLHLKGAVAGAGVWRTMALHSDKLWVLVVLTLGFAATIILNFEVLRLYSREGLSSILHEQRLILQACSTSGLLLASTLYLLHPRDIRTTMAVSAVVLATALLSLRRLALRILVYRNFRHGVGTRNVLIVGTGPTAQAIRSHVQNMYHLGYTFKGFIEVPGSTPAEGPIAAEVIGALPSLFDEARRRFVDEILFTTQCKREDVQKVLIEARNHKFGIRLIPDLYDAALLNPSIEYLGQFPTIPLYRREMAEGRLLLKRAVDILVSGIALAGLLPLLLIIAILIKRESPGPVFYISERLGRKGQIFRCIKFRTMVEDADSLRATLASRNERDGVLFKIKNDPRVTRFGRFLRKYSLDEIPQFWNVLRGEMSVVGPRPPLAGEVKQYKIDHLRRLEVTPGITGLWQVQARKDPSFDKYVSLDMAYIENWSLWLDLEIMLRTIGVIFAGTGY